VDGLCNQFDEATREIGGDTTVRDLVLASQTSVTAKP